MKKVYVWTLLAAALIVPIAEAQQVAGKPPAADRSTSVTVEFSSTDQLLAEGWEEVEPSVWRKAFDNGMAAEVALGAAGHGRALKQIDADIEALLASENLDREQELRLFELLVRREQLGEIEPQTKDSYAAGMCTGTATFTHDYGWENFSYPFAESVTVYSRWSQVGTATTYAEASLCGSGQCSEDSERDNSGYGFLVDAYAGGIPTWTCFADAYGYVFLGGSGLPTQCLRFAYFSTDWNC